MDSGIERLILNFTEKNELSKEERKEYRTLTLLNLNLSLDREYQFDQVVQLDALDPRNGILYYYVDGKKHHSTLKELFDQ